MFCTWYAPTGQCRVLFDTCKHFGLKVKRVSRGLRCGGYGLEEIILPCPCPSLKDAILRRLLGNFFVTGMRSFFHVLYEEPSCSPIQSLPWTSVVMHEVFSQHLTVSNVME